MKAPDFWHCSKIGLKAQLLRPLGAIYGGLTTKRALKPPKASVDLPVLCVGNLSLGGSGKTPTVQSLGRLFQESGKTPFVLSRGYGGLEKGPVLITDQSASQVGDEPVLLSKTLPVVVSRDRVCGARLCQENGADLILMDDGFQNPDLKKDFSLCVVDGGVGFGNGLVFPAGPLREPLHDGLVRAHAVLIIGEDQAGVEAHLQATHDQIPLLHATVHPRADTLDRSAAYVAFAGIARPQKFFDSLTALDLNVLAFQGFGDHHAYHRGDLERLYEQARVHQARLITTEKDWVRLAPEDQRNVDLLKIDLEWQDKDLLKALLSDLL